MIVQHPKQRAVEYRARCQNCPRVGAVKARSLSISCRHCSSGASATGHVTVTRPRDTDGHITLLVTAAMHMHKRVTDRGKMQTTFFSLLKLCFNVNLEQSDNCAAGIPEQ